MTKSAVSLITTSIISIALLISIVSCNSSQKSNESTNEYSPPNSSYSDSLTLTLEQELKKGHLPGFALSIFTKDSILYQKGFGYSDIKNKKPYTVNSVQIIASITKTFIGVALMKAVEDGKIGLDDDINDILPYRVSNPKFPNTPITIRHLASKI